MHNPLSILADARRATLHRGTTRPLRALPPSLPPIPTGKDHLLAGYDAFVAGEACTPPSGLDADNQTNWRDGWHEAQEDAWCQR